MDLINKGLRLTKVGIGLSIMASIWSGQVFAEFQVQDSEGTKTLTSEPQRIAALNWDIAEQVIELGVTPIAVPDIAGYNEWVVQPPIPEGA